MKVNGSSLSVTGSDQDWGSGGNRAFIDTAGSNARIGGAQGGGSPVGLLFIAGNSNVVGSFNTSGVFTVSSGLANGVTSSGSAADPMIGTTAGNLLISPAGGTVAVTAMLAVGATGGSNNPFTGNSAQVANNGLRTNQAAYASQEWGASLGGIGPGFYILKSRGATVGNYAAVVNGDNLGCIGWAGTDGTASQQSALVRATVSGTVSAGIVPATLHFQVASNAGIISDVMQITASMVTIYSGLANGLMLSGSAANPNIGTTAGFLSLEGANGGVFSSNSSNPILGLNWTSGGVDQKMWWVDNGGGSLSIHAGNDTLMAGTAAYTIGRGSGYNIASHAWYTSAVAGAPVLGMQLTAAGVTIGGGFGVAQAALTVNGRSLSVTGSDQDWGSGGNRAFIDTSGSNARIGGAHGGGSPVGLLFIAGNSNVVGSFNTSGVFTASSGLANGITITGGSGGSVGTSATIGTTAGHMVLAPMTTGGTTNCFIYGTIAAVHLYDPGLGSNAKDWALANVGGAFGVFAGKDDNSGSTQAYAISRSGYNVTTHTWYTSTTPGTTIPGLSLDSLCNLNILNGGSASAGGGAGVVCLANATTAPTGTPSGGGILYVSGGALKYKGSSGTVTTLAPA
jgi:hypothetical protein